MDMFREFQVTTEQALQGNMSKKKEHSDGLNFSHDEQLSDQVPLRFVQRHTMLQEACRKYSNSSLFRTKKVATLFHAAYWPVSNVSVRYCPIEKTGTTKWRATFKAITDAMKENNVSASGFSAHLNPKYGYTGQPLKRQEAVAQHRPELQDSEKSFVFVRDPYKRLFSAYVDKLFSPNCLFWSATGRYIVRNFRNRPSEKSMMCGHDVTFPEFVRYVIHAQSTGEHRDGHFIPAHDHCKLCEIPYDYIGHLETYRKDAAYLMKVMQVPVEYKEDFDQMGLSNPAFMVFKFFRKCIPNCMTMDEAARRLWKKYQIRGLISRLLPFPLTPDQAEKIDKDEFVDVATQSHINSGDLRDVRQQTKEAIKEAYSFVPLADRLKLRQVFFLDFEMFGYHLTPDIVFPEFPTPPLPNNFSYFKL
jgi:hypothetical protein